MSEKEKKEFRGFDIPNKSYYIGDNSWKIIDDCKLPKKYEELEKIVYSFEETATKLENKEIDEKESVKISRQCTKEILEMTLEGFDYDIVLQKVGYTSLDRASIGLAELFLKIGGMDEFELMVSRIRRGENPPIGPMEQTKNTS